MASPQILTLFTETENAGGVPSLLVSLLVHGAALGLVWLGVARRPLILQASVHASDPVRMIHLNASSDRNPSADAVRRTLAWDLPQSGKPAPAEGRTSSAGFRSHQPQILMQSDTPMEELHAPVAPSLMIVAPKLIPTDPITEPSQPEAAAAGVRPKLEMPNGAIMPADVNVAPSFTATEAFSVVPTSTSPIVVLGPLPAQAVPRTVSETESQSAFVRIMSISGQNLSSGTVVLPPVSAVPSRIAPGTGEPGPSQESLGSGISGNEKAQEAGPDAGSNSSAKRVSLPKDGHFPVVLVGDSIQETYPETAGTWKGRLAYTVYVPVDTGKRWILQYSLSPSAHVLVPGSGGRPEAPWPVDMLVPNLDAYLTGVSAVIVHGILTPEGRLDDLAVAFPPQFPGESLLIGSLKKWVFRPAAQSGHPVELEILLIIPGTE